MKRLKKLTALCLLVAGGISLTASSINAGCSYSPVPGARYGTCTWGEEGHYCEMMVTPYISCTAPGEISNE